MKYEWDENKCEVNFEKHGVDFEAVQQFDWMTAQEIEDLRFDYGELRFRALGCICGRLYVLVFTRRKDVVRVISLRKANSREEKTYG